jgi:imidazole glycerol-phosphate synthase subunit HisH
MKDQPLKRITGVVDYDAGNLRSVDTALTHLGIEHLVSNDPAELESCDVLIVPGVGEAASAMRVLRTRGLDRLIIAHAESGKRTIGICLGCQIFTEHSEERDTACLGLLPGRVVRFPPSPGMKIPHMGWNQVHYSGRPPLFDGIPDGRSFYFVHSYCIDPASTPDTVGYCDHSMRFSAVLAKGEIVAFQFHPEKSGAYGLRLLANAIAEGG